MKKQLFSLLTKLGFNKSIKGSFIFFTFDDVVLVFPKGRLSKHHYFIARINLDAANILPANKFNLRFKKVL